MSDSRTRQATQRPSRRTFLKTSTTVSAAVLAGGLTIGRGAHAAGDDLLRVGLIGCGGRGTGAAGNALGADKHCKLVAMADMFADRLEGSLSALRKREPERVAVDQDHCFVGFDAYEKLLQSGVDVVILATPPHFRPMHLKACVEAGKHIFCEKPVAVDAPGVRSVLATSEEAARKGLALVSGLCWRYHKAMRETMKRVMDGAIGEVVAMQETYNTGILWERPRQPEWTEMEFQLRNWYYFTWLSGDHNVEQHIHSLDKATWLMHDEPPVKAWGLGGRQVRTEAKFGNIYDHHAVVYEYANGMPLYSYCRQMAGCWNETSDLLIGTKGRCHLLRPRADAATTKKSSDSKSSPQRKWPYQIEGENPWRYEGPDCDMYHEEHVAMFDSIRAGQPINNGLYMARSTMLAILGRMATYTGQAITWEKAINSSQLLSPATYAMDAEPPILPDQDGRYPIAMPGVTKIV
jgi:myo-inositol 2-dehydrogenase / D-chiro-inositol 1-dehydrogenase